MKTDQETKKILMNDSDSSPPPIPNLSVIDQITIEYMMNKRQKDAIKKFFSGSGGDAVADNKEDLRIPEYEIYQESVKELFSKMLDEFILGESSKKYKKKFLYRFHSFMDCAIKYLADSKMDDDYSDEEDEDNDILFDNEDDLYDQDDQDYQY